MCKEKKCPIINAKCEYCKKYIMLKCIKANSFLCFVNWEYCPYGKSKKDPLGKLLRWLVEQQKEILMGILNSKKYEKVAKYNAEVIKKVKSLK